MHTVLFNRLKTPYAQSNLQLRITYNILTHLRSHAHLNFTRIKIQTHSYIDSHVRKHTHNTNTQTNTHNTHTRTHTHTYLNTRWFEHKNT